MWVTVGICLSQEGSSQHFDLLGRALMEDDCSLLRFCCFASATMSCKLSCCLVGLQIPGGS